MDDFYNILSTVSPKLSSFTFNISTVISFSVFFALLCACIVIGHLIEEYPWINESTTSILLGLASGAVVLLVRKGESSHILSFSEDLFFIYLLPPIIFNAGFQVMKKRFFRNFSIIFLFGAVGTLISFCIITPGVYFVFKSIGITSLRIQDYLAIGAIFSATDSVCTLQVLNQEQTPILYSLVFGEGVVNDATAIVLFNAVQTLDFNNINATTTALKLLGTFFYLLITSTILGIAVGLLSAYVMKKLYLGRHSTDREVALMMLMAYLSYMLSEMLSLSGILTVFFCGIVMSHYTWHNVTESSRITTKHSFATISFIAETFIFLYVGMDALDIDKWKASHSSVLTSVTVSSTLLALVLIGRAAFVFPLASIANCLRRSRTKIVFRQQLIIWWAGLMRGAVTIALSYNQFTDSGTTPSQSHALMITSTIIVVLFSTVVFGSCTKSLILAVLFHKPAASQPHSLEDIRLLFLETGGPLDEGGHPIVPRGSSMGLLMQYPASTVHYYWKRFDDRYMKPLFGGHGFSPIAPSTPTESQHGPSQHGSSHHGSSHHGSSHGPSRLGPSHQGSSQHLSSQLGPSHHGSSQLGPSEHGSSQLGPSRLGPSHQGSSQHLSSQLGPSHHGSSQLGPSEHGSSQLGPSRLGPSQHLSSQLGPSHHESSQLGPSEHGSSQHGPS